MLTGGQLSSLSTGGGAVSPTACDFDPNNWLNREPIEGLELESDEAPNMLPPPQPDSTAPATASASASATRRWPGRPVAAVRIISLLRIIPLSPRASTLWRALKGARGGRVITAQ